MAEGFGSVVRTSVVGWQTFPDLWLAYDHFVGRVSTIGQLFQRVLVLVQRYNVVWLHDTFPAPDCTD